MTMRYYKQFHAWPFLYLIAGLFGCVCMGLIFVWSDFSIKLGFLVCATCCFIMAWIMWKDRGHYLEISQNWIIHYGFKQWKVKRADVLRVEQGEKGFVNEYDPYIKVYALGKEYLVDDGFLTNQQRIKKLVQAMQGTDSPRNR